MEPDATIGTTLYVSVFHHGVDEKRRVQIPAKWLSKDAVEFTVILWPQAKEGPCLRVLPQSQMAKLMRQIDAMPNENPEKVPLKRFIGSESAQVAVDKGGRICLPEKMAKDAGIADKAVLVGLLDVFEIWNPERFDKVKAADAVMAHAALKIIG